MGYYYDDENDDKMDPKLREALQINNEFMPQNEEFQGQKEGEGQEKQPEKKRCFVAIKKQRNMQ